MEKAYLDTPIVIFPEVFFIQIFAKVPIEDLTPKNVVMMCIVCCDITTTVSATAKSIPEFALDFMECYANVLHFITPKHKSNIIIIIH